MANGENQERKGPAFFEEVDPDKLLKQIYAKLTININGYFVEHENEKEELIKNPSGNSDEMSKCQCRKQTYYREIEKKMLELEQLQNKFKKNSPELQSIKETYHKIKEFEKIEEPSYSFIKPR